MYWALGYLGIVLLIFHIGHLVFDLYNDVTVDETVAVIGTILFPLAIIACSGILIAQLVSTFFVWYTGKLNTVKEKIIGRKKRKEWEKKNKAAFEKEKLRA